LDFLTTHMDDSTWRGVAQAFCAFNLSYVNDARQEKDLINAFADVSTQYHDEIRRGRTLASLLDQGPSSVARWHDEEETVKLTRKSNLSSSQGSVYKFAAFLNFLRINPKAVAILATMQNNSSKKIKSLLGTSKIHDRTKSDLARTLIALYSNVFEKRELCLFRGMFRAVLEAEFQKGGVSKFPTASSFFAPEKRDSSIHIHLITSYFNQFSSYLASAFARQFENVCFQETSIDPAKEKVLDDLHQEGVRRDAAAAAAAAAATSPVIKKTGSKMFFGKKNKNATSTTYIASTVIEEDSVREASATFSSNSGLGRHSLSYGQISTDRVIQIHRVRSKLLKECCEPFLDGLAQLSCLLPLQMKTVLGDVLAFAEEHWPGSFMEEQTQLVAILLYANHVLPAFAQPQNFGLYKLAPGEQNAGFSPTAKCRANIDVVIRVLRGLLFHENPDRSPIPEWSLQKGPVAQTSLAQLVGVCRSLPTVSEVSSKYLVSEDSSSLCEEVLMQATVELFPQDVLSLYTTLFPGGKLAKTMSVEQAGLLDALGADSYSDLDVESLEALKDRKDVLVVDVSSSCCTAPGQELNTKKLEHRPTISEITQVVDKYLTRNGKAAAAVLAAATTPALAPPAQQQPPASDAASGSESQTQQTQQTEQTQQTQQTEQAEQERREALAKAAEAAALVMSQLAPDVANGYKLYPLKLLRVLVRALLQLDPILYSSYTGDQADLVQLLQYCLSHLEPQALLASSNGWPQWDTHVSQAALLSQILSEIRLLPASLREQEEQNGFALLKTVAADALKWVEQEHSAMWRRRQARLRKGLVCTQASIRAVRTEAEFANSVVLRHKVANFCSQVHGCVNFRLSASMKQRLQETAPGGEHSGVFTCESVGQFVERFMELRAEWHHDHLDGAAKLLRSYCEVVKDVLSKDRLIGFSSVQDDKERAQSLALAMRLVEQRLFCQLFPVLFPNDQSRFSFMDAELEQAFGGLTWLKPHHLNIPDVSDDPQLWQQSVDTVNRLDTCHSPRDKMAVLAQAIKWMSKMLSVTTLDSVDADTCLSALIYLIVKAKPQRIRSNLHFIETFLDVVGENQYCYMQLEGALSYIDRTLSKFDKASFEKYMEEEKERERRRKQQAEKPKSKAFTTMMQQKPELLEAVLAFMSTENVCKMTVFVSKVWAQCSQNVLRQQKEQADAEVALATSNAATRLRQNSTPIPAKQLAVANFLAEPERAQQMIGFCENHLGEHEKSCLLFYTAVNKYKALPLGSQQQVAEGYKIFDTYIEMGAEMEVGVEDDQRHIARVVLGRTGFRRDSDVAHVTGTSVMQVEEMNDTDFGERTSRSTSQFFWDIQDVSDRRNRSTVMFSRPAPLSELFDSIRDRVLCFIMVQVIKDFEQKHGIIS